MEALLACAGSSLDFKFVLFSQEIIEPLLQVLEQSQKEKDMKELYHRATVVYHALVAPRKVIIILKIYTKLRSKVKVGVLCPIQQPGSYCERFSALPLVGIEPTQR